MERYAEAVAALQGFARAFNVDGATEQSTPENGKRADQEGRKMKIIFVSWLPGPAEKVYALLASDRCGNAG